MKIEEQVSHGIMDAMKAKDKVRLETLRNIKKYIIEAKTASTEVTELSDAECLKIINKLAKQGSESAEIYRNQNRADLADYEMAQVAVLKEFLPKQLSPAELTDAIAAIIAQCGASSMKEMGKVMGLASKSLAGKAEGKAISDEVKKQLS